MANIEQYADAILSMVHGGRTPQHAVKALAAHLAVRGRGGLLAHLAPALLRKAAALEQGAMAVLEVARANDAAHAGREAAPLFSSPTATVVREDETLIGGWRLISGSSLIDNSHKKHLLDFYRNVTR